MKTHTLAITLAISGLISAQSVAAGPTAEMLSYTCAGCHGTDGSSVGPASPSIAGTDPSYFTDTMLAYKSAERPSTIMTRIAKGYSDEEIEAMAEFFAGQKLVLMPQKHDAGKAARGKELHDEYCEKCHEDGGRNPEDSSILAGQWMPYLHISMDEFVSGEREQPKKMKKKVDKMLKKAGDGAVEDLVHFYGSFK